MNQNAFESNQIKEDEANSSNPPKLYPVNNTLYLNRINEKIPLDDLKQELYNIFSTYGKILKITAKKNIKMRGQAFIIFKEAEDATNALNDLQGKEFYGQNLVSFQINYAKEKSDEIAKLEGNFVPREKNKNKDEKIVPLGEKKIKYDTGNSKNLVSSKTVSKHTIIPNNILFCENLPVGQGIEVLNNLFQQYPGFREVRLIPKRNCAFIEYEEEYQAGLALSGLIGTRLDDTLISLNYAKR